jgi:hypothetical protein
VPAGATTATFTATATAVTTTQSATVQASAGSVVEAWRCNSTRESQRSV